MTLSLTEAQIEGLLGSRPLEDVPPWSTQDDKTIEEYYEALKTDLEKFLKSQGMPIWDSSRNYDGQYFSQIKDEAMALLKKPQIQIQLIREMYGNYLTITLARSDIYLSSKKDEGHLTWSAFFIRLNGSSRYYAFSEGVISSQITGFVHPQSGPSGYGHDGLESIDQLKTDWIAKIAKPVEDFLASKNLVRLSKEILETKTPQPIENWNGPVVPHSTYYDAFFNFTD